MSVANMFEKFLENLKIDNEDIISSRYAEITASLNKYFRDTESKTNNSLQVGSYGRHTAIKDISDLDMIYFLPQDQWERFKTKQSYLLQETKKAIKERYPNTEMSGDGQVVTVSFTDGQTFEILPAFEEDDGSFKYPDTNDGGSWKNTDPRKEIDAISELNKKKNGNLRELCKMARAWKNKHGIEMGGLLIDTLSYNFLNDTTDYDEKSYSSFDSLVKDFFNYLLNLPSEQTYYYAPGSKQRVNVKKSFQKKAKEAYDLCLKAIEAKGSEGVNKKWIKIFGKPFPLASSDKDEKRDSEINYDNTEEFIEDRYPIDIRYHIKLDCEVTQNGVRNFWLLEKLDRIFKLRPKNNLLFKVIENDIPEPFELKWKVLNKGIEAQKRNLIRGQILDDAGYLNRNEETQFRGDHIVECYAIKNGVVVAKDSILVPIE
ncbi:nucleotidyltransferase [Pigmentibacter sp. JX0631]|uniref:SMODS domain-containing nucleotidyltransferase n=1 Tax=Pigmentibacter sp. JX0631 TaxID=2976982 RepID=UPI0032AF3D5E